MNPTTMLESATSSNFEVATVMMVQTTSIEEQIANLMKAVEELTKHIQEQDSQITKLMNKVDNADTGRLMSEFNWLDLLDFESRAERGKFLNEVGESRVQFFLGGSDLGFNQTYSIPSHYFFGSENINMEC
ncbi:hypothetical protein Pfo_018024 [Paulownia fortunei]|nr:hypothetical protein Pfo_018024 [Paulownia fortunei]